MPRLSALFIILLLRCISSSFQCPECGTSYKTISIPGTYGGCYCLSDGMEDTWENAETACSDQLALKNSSLAIFHSREETRKIGIGLDGLNAWIGLSLNSDAKDYVWIDGSPMNFADWEPLTLQFDAGGFVPPLTDIIQLSRELCVQILDDNQLLWQSPHCQDTIQSTPLLISFPGGRQHIPVERIVNTSMGFREPRKDHACVSITKHGKWISNNCTKALPYLCQVHATGPIIEMTNATTTPVALVPMETDDETQTECPKCPDQYDQIQRSDECYCMSTGQLKLSWKHATQACEQIVAGSTLAKLRTKEQSDFVASKSHNNVPIWIGLSDQASEGTFTWQDGSGLVIEDWQPLTINFQLGDFRLETTDLIQMERVTKETTKNCITVANQSQIVWESLICNNSETNFSDAFNLDILVQPGSKRGLPLPYNATLQSISDVKEPLQFNGNTKQDCVLTSQAGRWKLASCDTKLNFLCQLKGPLPPPVKSYVIPIIIIASVVTIVTLVAVVGLVVIINWNKGEYVVKPRPLPPIPQQRPIVVYQPQEEEPTVIRPRSAALNPYQSLNDIRPRPSGVITDTDRPAPPRGPPQRLSDEKTYPSIIEDSVSRIDIELQRARYNAAVGRYQHEEISTAEHFYDQIESDCEIEELPSDD